MRTLGAISLGLFYLVGCKSDKPTVEADPDVLIEGQVFVVTKSRENIKMGLTPIHVVSDEELKEIAVTLHRNMTDFLGEASNFKAREEINQDLLSIRGEITAAQLMHSHAMRKSYRPAQEKLDELKQSRDQIQIQIRKLIDTPNEDLIRIAAGLELPENQVTVYYTGYRWADEQVKAMIASGLGPNHPEVKAMKLRADGALENAGKEVVSLKEVMETRLNLANKQVETMEQMVREIKNKDGFLNINEACTAELAELEQEVKSTIGDGVVRDGYRANESFAYAKKTLFSLLPSAVTKTDADGKFKISINSERWVLAQGQRSVGAENEEYLWITRTAKPITTSLLLVSNDSGIDGVEALYAFLASLVAEVEGVPIRSENDLLDDETRQWVEKLKRKANRVKAKVSHLKKVAEAIQKAQVTLE